MKKITDETLKQVITSLDDVFDKELFAVPANKLEENYYHFKWDPMETAEWNTYKFHDLLKLYGSFCRRWEEHHNGSCCVVERVRDKYLMPKIRDFISDLKRHIVQVRAEDAKQEVVGNL